MRAVVVALGKIGLPIAAQLALRGHDVIGCDIDAEVVDIVNAGHAPFPGETGLATVLEEVVGSGKLAATTDTAAAVSTEPDLVIAVPPLVVDTAAQPDWSVLDAVIDDIGRGLQGTKGVTVSIETTVPVGTTRNRVAPALAARSGLQAEVDFHVVFSPERVYSGRIFEDLANYPKLVGGLSPTGETRGVALYGQFLDADVQAMAAAEAAELTKLVETTYRDVNIALANEFARHADALGLDIQQVIDAANSQPFSHVHRPGVAVGGHCIPVYPRFYLSGDPSAQLPAIARNVNEAMPAYAVDMLEAELGGLKDRRVVILGVTYRGGVRETAFSGAFALRDVLTERGAHPVAADPMYDPAELRDLGFMPWDGSSADAAIVQADHASYAELTPEQLPAKVIVDGRGILDPEKFRAAGITVRRIGRP